jgi:hypothetical protein
MWAIKLKDAIPEKYEPKRCHIKKVCAKLKRKRVKLFATFGAST